MEIVKFHKNNQMQRLRNHYLDDSIELSPEDTEKLNLFEKIYGMRIDRKYQRFDIVTILMRPKTSGGEGLTRATAYRCYQNAMMLFGDLDKVDHASEITFLKSALHEEYILAKKAGDRKNAISALKELAKLSPKDADNKIDPEQYNASIFRQILPPPVKKMFRKAAERGVVDLMFLGAEDVEYMEVDENDEDNE